MKILVVDDELDIRTLARASLALVGKHEVVLAASAREGLELARTASPDVVLLDLVMPGMDGVAVMQALRDDPATRAIPIVFLTARAAPAEVARYVALGARGAIEKPFDPMTLSEAIARVLAG